VDAGTPSLLPKQTGKKSLSINPLTFPSPDPPSG
jgi:hypothetical protein